MTDKLHWGWSTKDEIAFIKRIGKISDTIKGKIRSGKITRQTLLEGYRKAILKRVEWGTLDPDKVTFAVLKEIDKEKTRREKHETIIRTTVPSAQDATDESAGLHQ